MYRVYDNKEKKWLREGFYLSPNNDLSISGKAIFGHSKMSLVSDSRYTYQMSIGLKDINNIEIFEGDICQSNDGLIGLIAYTPEKASYLFFDYKHGKYYPLSTKICSEFLKVVGNTFETPELIEEGDSVGQ